MAWEQVKVGIGWITPDDFMADVTYVDDRAFTGLTPDDLLERRPAGDHHAVLLIVDLTIANTDWEDFADNVDSDGCLASPWPSEAGPCPLLARRKVTPRVRT
ncbi:DUF6924 domain-containing protein [Amycolatopsis sp. lyj-109]|uniref:DUF6924 domain-containing protein n=1 Tax=Amycolatopsis sp. lyj-109 TaxID=2789287 RepID=UPI003978AD87